MKMRLLFAMGLALCASGCYRLRWTDNFLQYPDICDTQKDVADEAGLTELDRQRRRDYLEAVASAPEPGYRINAGDRMQISVYDHPELSTAALVAPDGTVGIVFLGQVKLAGLTPAEAAKLIQDGLAGYINKPAVGVTPVDIASESVSIVGGVRSPGLFVIYNGMRLADLYAKCGGSDVRNFDGQWLDVADLVHSVFLRDGKVVPIDFRKAIEDGDPVENLKLRKGDYIYIGVRSEKMVCVIGDVMRPHKRIWDDNLGVLEVLTTAGWTHETYYPWVVIIRGGLAHPRMYRLNVDKILAGESPNVFTEAGDIIYVPKDDISEYNVFVRKLMPTVQLLNLFTTRMTQSFD